MYNLHLLQLNISVIEYRAKFKDVSSLFKNVQQLPVYLIARCPFCSTEYVEHLDTYSPQHWTKPERDGDAVFLSPQYWTKPETDEDAAFLASLMIKKCQHFVLVQPFFRWQPTENPRSRYADDLAVAGHLLESGLCLAVMHALPVCRIRQHFDPYPRLDHENFEPVYNLFTISYFSEHTKREIEKACWPYQMEVEAGVVPPTFPQFALNKEEQARWEDLRGWVKAGQLYWIDATDPVLPIRTHDVNAFPYGDVPGAWEGKNI